MKYLKRFNETDSWAGSLYAYSNPIPPKRGPDEFNYPLKQTYLYKCEECGVESYCFKEEVICASCGSENLKEVS